MFSLIVKPLVRRARRKALAKSGWLELHLEGEIREVRHPSRLPPIVKRWLRREDPPQVILSRLRHFASEAADDPLVRAILVRIDQLGGGWASAAAVRAELDKLRDAGKEIYVHLAKHAGNREFLVASAATHLSMTPAGTIAAVGTSSIGLFLKDTLDRFGVRVEVAAKGRFKSAPEQLTRTSRSEWDLLQTKALIDACDGALAEGIQRGRKLDAAKTKTLIDRAPIIGVHAHAEGWCDELAREEDLPERVQAFAKTPEPPNFVGAGRYLMWSDRLRPRKRRREKFVGVVEAHGAIVDQASTYGSYFDRLAVQKVVVNDLRAALEDPQIGAVVLHVDSRGGSVTASDGIWSAVRRLDREKPVIACFGDVSASGGYYIACGARAIVCSPLTVTGSIGVFGMYPTWPELGERFAVHHDVVKNHTHAALLDPWAKMPEEAIAHAEKEIDAMYEAFLALVAAARKKTRDQVHEVAEGRVWTGAAALGVGLVDGLGGMEEAMQRAKDAVPEVRFAPDPVYVHARGHHDRPGAPKAKNGEDGAGGVEEIVREIVMLLRSSRSVLPIFAYAPITL